MNAALKDLLFVMRQHAGFPELLGAVERPQMPRFKQSKGETLEQIGARTAYASGGNDQHDNWLAFLSGSPVPPQGETQPSEQEKS